MTARGDVDSSKTDVLVIGGGGAAMVAACAAAELGATVRMVSKKRPGVGSCTAYAGGGFTVATEGVTPERHTEFTLRTGRNVNNHELVHILSAEGDSGLDRLASWGVHVEKRRGGATVRQDAPNPMVGGMGMTVPLASRCRKLGVIIEYPVTVTRLLQHEFGGRVVGADGVDATGAPKRYYAPVTILATGGGGWLYARTDNPTGISGDGYSLALNAGARLRDMEFVQFYPLGSAPDSGTTWFVDAGILDYARLTDGNDEEFLPALLTEWGLSGGRQVNSFARDRLSQAIARRWRDTGRVLLHLEDIPESKRQDPELLHIVRLLGSRGDNPWQPVGTLPVQHFMSGGVVIDAQGSTGVPGLYACGEVTGGVHGANRVGGNALNELTVFGIRAGKTAAREAARSEQDHGDDAATMPSTASTDEDPFFTPVSIELGGGYRPWKAMAHSPKVQALEPRAFSAPALRNLAFNQLGPIRDHEGLVQALWQLENWTQELGAQNAQSQQTGGDAANMLTTARLIALAALTRQESRGCHYRSDFPDERDAGLGNVYLEPRIVGPSEATDESPAGTVVVTPVMRPVRYH